MRRSRWGVIGAAGVLAAVGFVAVPDGDAGAAAPTVSVAKTVLGVVEGDAGTTAATVTVTLSAPSASTVTVAWTTADGTAKVAKSDYLAAGGTVSFAPGQTTREVSVDVQGDTTLEDYEVFTVKLSAPVNATLGNATEKVQIRNDETPKLTLATVKVAEGAPAVFKPKLAQAFHLPVTLTAVTAAGTATTPADFTAVNRQVVVPAGTKAAPTVPVPTITDGTTEPSEAFSLQVTGPAVVAGQTKVATITGDLCRNAAPPAHYDHVVVVVMENRRYTEVIGNAAAPWTTAVAKGCATAKAYAQAASPSRPNYLALTAGSVFDCAGSNADPAGGTCHPTSDSVFKQVIDAGGTAITYAEGMNGNCDATSHGVYAVKHNAWPYFTAEAALCQQFDRPLPAALPVDDLPTLLTVYPDLCHDTHDCPVATGDAWLRQYLQPVFDSPAYLAGSTAVIVTYDEYTNLPNFLAAPSVKEGTAIGTPTSHYGLLRTIEDLLGLPPLGQAATATSLRTAAHL